MTFLAVIDPAWGADAGGGGRGAQNHYALAGIDAIAQGYRGARETEPNPGPLLWPSLAKETPCLVFMWATVGAMAQKPTGDPPDAYVLARLLGLRVCAGVVWCKIDRFDLAHPTWFVAPLRMGLGQWTRCEHEHLLICRRGDVPVPDTASRPRSVIYAERGEHSEKPEEAWTQVIEPIARSCMPDRVGVEFNCRKQRAGWSAFGALDGEDKPLRYSQDKAVACER